MKWILPVIVCTQFFCTSLWFAGNAVTPELLIHYHLGDEYLGHFTSAIQFGFIIGTLVFAVFTIADRYSPSLVFFMSAVLAAFFNLGITIDEMSPISLLVFRFLTGFLLAGIYPVGMKIASDYYNKGLGTSLGYLVGALVLGTAFPHLLKSFTLQFSWQYVLYGTSVLSVLGGTTMYLFVPDGPYRKQGYQLKLSAFLQGFKNKKFRAASLGYFGHMWELYAFWAFVPVILSAYNLHYQGASLNIPLYSFLIIASGSISCVAGGYISQWTGDKITATTFLLLSGVCCIASPIFLFHSSKAVFLIFLFFWGMVVIADSPLFSTMVAKNSTPETRGSSLTIVNSIGFAITIVSIQLISVLINEMNVTYIYTLLAVGPVVGLLILFGDKENGTS
jgi:MFS family permease